ncbi:MAG: carbamoyltransferase C-terminal domain-containing protein, partial [Acidimicrobiales bacterium]
SLGEVYTALTWYLGFRPNADEGKVMGLAPYGSSRLAAELRDLVDLRPDGLFRVNLDWFGYQRESRLLAPRFLERFGPARVPESEITAHHQDMAYAVQHLIEEAALHVARGLQRATGAANLCVAGGVALNSVMNTRLLREAGFEHVFVQPAASDAGNALGAALWVWHQELGHPRGWRMDHAFLGATFDAREQAEALSARGLRFEEVRDPAAVAAQLLADGKVVGWFQGRAEIGPRALGARSILADPRRAAMKDVVNARIKRREGFRPFAPSVLHERGAEYFESYYPTPFMLHVQTVRKEKRDVIPAVTHVDGTGRLQSVTADFNPAFHRLIEEFDRLTGVPVVLNTSFNLRGEPMVHRPAEAVEDYLKSEMDALLLGPYLAEKDRPA